MMLVKRGDILTYQHEQDHEYETNYNIWLVLRRTDAPIYFGENWIENIVLERVVLASSSYEDFTIMQFPFEKGERQLC